MVACDIHRPAAVDQLKMLGEQVNLPVFSLDSKDPVYIANEAIAYSKKFARDVVIVDTAGRLTIDEDMMTEIKNV